MADLPTAPTAPGAEEGLIADRRRFWSSFTGTTMVAGMVVAGVLLLLLVFVV